jgi:hypothetical protein
MPFCLTTGRVWMFGFVDTSLSPTCWKMSNTVNIHEPLLPQTLTLLMTLLMLWESKRSIHSQQSSAIKAINIGTAAKRGVKEGYQDTPGGRMVNGPTFAS